MGNNNHDEPHRHPDLATRERHLNELILALKKSGMTVGAQGDGQYSAGYASYNKESRFAKQQDGWSLAT